MAWIKSYQELERHPKTIVLMKEMNWSLDMTISKLHRLWWWCADYAFDGNLDKHDPDTISTAIGCADMKGEYLITALVNAGFVDRKPNLRLHDWWAHFGDFLRGKFARTPEKWKAIEKCYTNTSKALVKCSPLDKENKEKKIKREETTKRVAFATPTIEQIRLYCTERGGLVNPIKWMAHYESNGWRVGKNPMKDWKAAIRTWEHNNFDGQVITPERKHIDRVNHTPAACNPWETDPDGILKRG